MKFKPIENLIIQDEDILDEPNELDEIYLYYLIGSLIIENIEVDVNNLEQFKLFVGFYLLNMIKMND